MLKVLLNTSESNKERNITPNNIVQNENIQTLENILTEGTIVKKTNAEIRQTNATYTYTVH